MKFREEWIDPIKRDWKLWLFALALLAWQLYNGTGSGDFTPFL